jgi:hypothetical protein
MIDKKFKSTSKIEETSVIVNEPNDDIKNPTQGIMEEEEEDEEKSRDENQQKNNEIQGILNYTNGVIHQLISHYTMMEQDSGEENNGAKSRTVDESVASVESIFNLANIQKENIDKLQKYMNTSNLEQTEQYKNILHRIETFISSIKIDEKQIDMAIERKEDDMHEPDIYKIIIKELDHLEQIAENKLRCSTSENNEPSVGSNTVQCVMPHAIVASDTTRIRGTKRSLNTTDVSMTTYVDTQADEVKCIQTAIKQCIERYDPMQAIKILEKLISILQDEINKKNETSKRLKPE